MYTVRTFWKFRFLSLSFWYLNITAKKMYAHFVIILIKNFKTRLL